jgi:hypothetical protein
MSAHSDATVPRSSSEVGPANVAQIGLPPRASRVAPGSPEALRRQRSPVLERVIGRRSIGCGWPRMFGLATDPGLRTRPRWGQQARSADCRRRAPRIGLRPTFAWPSSSCEPSHRAYRRPRQPESLRMTAAIPSRYGGRLAPYHRWGGPRGSQIAYVRAFRSCVRTSFPVLLCSPRSER